MLARQRDGGDDVVRIAREDDADRNLAIVGGVGRVERARSVVESNFPSDRALQLRRQNLGVDVQRLDAVAVLDARPHGTIVRERDRIEARPLVAILRRCDPPTARFSAWVSGIKTSYAERHHRDV